MLIRRRGHGGGGAPAPPPTILSRVYSWGRPHTAKLGGNYSATTGSAIESFPYPQAISVSDVIQVATGSTATFLLTGNREVFHSGNGEGAGGAIGRNDVVHTMPNGKLIKLASNEWTRVWGNRDEHGNPLPLYLEENHANQSWITRRGPYGPALPTQADVEAGRSTWTIAAISVCGPLVLMLTTDGRVLAAGGGNQHGAHGGGQSYTDQKPGPEQEANQYPQGAPFWVLTGAPIQSETTFHDHGVQLVSGTPGTTSQVWAYDKDSDPTWGNGTRANVLKNVLAISVATQFAWYLKTDGRLFYSGGGGGAHGEAKESLYAVEDTLWTPFIEPGNLPVAIAGAADHCLLLLKDGTIRFVGHNSEGVAGTGVEETLPISTREVAGTSGNPILFSDGTHVKGVVAIAGGDTSYKLLLSDGTAWTTGSNFEYQQGLGAGTWAAKFVPVTRYTKITTCLNYKGESESLYGPTGTRKVVAISGGGEFTHEKHPEVKRQQGGVNGGDCYIFVLSDGTIRVLGLDWEYANLPGSSSRYETWGVSGHGDSQNYAFPVEPVGDPGTAHLTGITAAFNGPDSMFALKAGASPGSDSLTGSTAGTTMTVSWILPGEGEVGKMPFWREPSEWTIRLEGANGTDKIPVKKGESGATGTVHKVTVSNRTGGVLNRSASFTGLVRGTYYLITAIEESDVQAWNPTGSKWELIAAARVAPVGTTTESGGNVSVSWSALTIPEPGLILEVRRAEAFVSESLHDMPLEAALKVEPTTFLPITAAVTLTANTVLVIWDGTHVQTCVVSLKTSAGTSPVPVEAFTPVTPFAIGTVVFKSGAKLTAPLTAGVPITVIPAIVGQTFATGDTIVIQNGLNQDACVVAKAVKAGATQILVESGEEEVPLELEHSYPVSGTTIFKGKIEDWKRCVPDIDPAALTATRPVPESQYGLTGTELLWRLVSTWEPTYGNRQRLHAVPGIYRNEVGALDAINAKKGQSGTVQIVALGAKATGAFSISGQPAGMTINPDTGLISYTAGATAESKTITVKAEGADDVGTGWVDSTTFAWTVS